MDSALTPARLSTRDHLRLLVAKVLERCGWAGVAGLGMLASAAMIVSSERSLVAPASISSLHVEQPSGAPAKVNMPTQAVRLPTAVDVPVLLARIERAAVQERLGWPRAEYRLEHATADKPLNLNLNVKLQGPYVNVRRFVGAILRETPSLTLRALQISRANSDSSEVQAQLTVVIFLASDDQVGNRESR